MRLRSAHARRWGLTGNEGKRVRRKLLCAAWGAQLKGNIGWVGPLRAKLVHLMYLTALVATGGICNEDILRTLNEIWAYALTFRRSRFSLMFHVYHCHSPDRRRDTGFKLGTWSRNELLLLLALLGPFCLTDIRADFDPYIYAAHASPFGLWCRGVRDGPDCRCRAMEAGGHPWPHSPPSPSFVGFSP